ALPDKQTLPTVDAWNLTVQRQLSDSLSFEIGYVGNKGTHVFAGDSPDPDANEPTLAGFPDVPTNERQPFFEKFGWTQRIPFFCNCGDNRYDSLQPKLVGRPTGGRRRVAPHPPRGGDPGVARGGSSTIARSGADDPIGRAPTDSCSPPRTSCRSA